MNNNNQYYANNEHIIPSITTLYRTGGLVNEINYDSKQPFVLHLLLPFLQQLAQQSRWQLWLTSGKKINRTWLNDTGLPENKIIQILDSHKNCQMQAMYKALTSGNFSCVLIWSAHYFSDEEKKQLQYMAQTGNTYCFIIKSNATLLSIGDLLSYVEKSSLYH